ncbi:uncharacterized protein LOC119500416 [Xyrichtys novacula]|uniref:Taste receptor type 2 n=1 Tax=Xyrichtys novacula TaxID=13765 RepID=A0AAV1H379_XYRNO|nr:uncharacterized protein LOC119500416 [Xyrichtys novacula]
MAYRFIDLDQEAFILINGPLICLNLTTNIFYAYCLIFPPRNGPKPKQPLKILLEILVWSSITFCVSLSILHRLFSDGQYFVLFMVWYIVLSFVHNSMVCSVWLNFFYYIQIVPSQRAVLIWIKRNIRSVIYMTLLFGCALFLFSAAGSIAHLILLTPTLVTSINDTKAEFFNFELDMASKVYFCMIKAYILMCMCIMMISSFSTVIYLHRHIRSMAKGSSSFSTPKIQSQMRVTITGICQGVLYVLFDTFNLLESFTNKFSPHYGIGVWLSFTVTSLYISGTTVNLGIGQAAFRQRVVNIWKKFRAL